MRLDKDAPQHFLQSSPAESTGETISAYLTTSTFTTGWPTTESELRVLTYPMHCRQAAWAIRRKQRRNADFNILWERSGRLSLVALWISLIAIFN
jgi:hypothetical protein